MKYKNLIFCGLILIFFSCIEAKPPELTPRLAKKKSEEILKNHVMYKELSPEIIKRTLHNYIAELDPMKTYFLKKEVIRWENPSQKLICELKKDYDKEIFTHFMSIYQTMIQAIFRRGQLEDKIVSLPLSEDEQPSDFKDGDWAESVDELEKRLRKIGAIQLKTAKQLEYESHEKLIQRITKKRLNKEQEILQSGDNGQQNRQMLAYFLKSMSSALDTHTAYLTPTEANQFIIQVQQSLFGIGAQLRDDINGLTFVRLFEGGPALRGGKIKLEDKIIAVNHESIVGMDITEAVDLIRGPKGTTVSLTILREKDGEEREKFDIDLERDEVVLKELRLESETVPYDDGVIAHIHLLSFYQDSHNSSASDIKRVIEDIKRRYKLYGIILDLRDNIGGLLPQAVEVTALFIKKGVIVSIKDNEKNIYHLRNFNATPTWDGPLLVLINTGSASASEIVAQTLQDYGRALLVGDAHTWGKGSYQTCTLEIGNTNTINPQGEYKVTRGLYYTVSGKSPQLIGAQSDIEIPGILTNLEIGEKYLQFPLKNDQIAPNFIDNFSDIHPYHREKFMRHYKQDQQKNIDLYAPYRDILKQNSKMRIEKKGKSHGHNDLQLEETIYVMKDLLFLKQERMIAELQKREVGG